MATQISPERAARPGNTVKHESNVIKRGLQNPQVRKVGKSMGNIVGVLLFWLGAQVAAQQAHVNLHNPITFAVVTLVGLAAGVFVMFGLSDQD